MSLFKQGIAELAGEVAAARRFTSDGIPISTFDEWVWPLLVREGRFPEVSDRFYDREEGKRLGKRLNEDGSSRGHYGIDVLYLRDKEADKPEHFATLTKRYAMFFNSPSVIAGPGKVWSARMTGHGGEVKISHFVEGRPILTVHRHLNPINPEMRKGKLVKAGEEAGTIFYSPKDRRKIAHLHWELWRTDRPGTGREAWSIDPEPLLARIPIIDQQTGKKRKLPRRHPTVKRGKKKPLTGKPAQILGIIFMAGAALAWMIMFGMKGLKR